MHSRRFSTAAPCSARDEPPATGEPGADPTRRRRNPLQHPNEMHGLRCHRLRHRGPGGDRQAAMPNPSGRGERCAAVGTDGCGDLSGHCPSDGGGGRGARRRRRAAGGRAEVFTRTKQGYLCRYQGALCKIQGSI
jgi:hypothetical protein